MTLGLASWVEVDGMRERVRRILEVKSGLTEMEESRETASWRTRDEGEGREGREGKEVDRMSVVRFLLLQRPLGRESARRSHGLTSYNPLSIAQYPSVKSTN